MVIARSRQAVRRNGVDNIGPPPMAPPSYNAVANVHHRYPTTATDETVPMNANASHSRVRIFYIEFRTFVDVLEALLQYVGRLDCQDRRQDLEGDSAITNGCARM